MAKFLTVPDELLKVAQAAEAHFRNRGYKIRIEHRDLGYPYVPAFTATRKPTSIIIEVTSTIDIGRVRQWTRYCKSSARDLRFCTCVQHHVAVSPQVQAVLRREGVGLYYSNDNFMEIFPPTDQGLVLHLPDLAGFSAAVRDLLGPCYEKHERGDWRESFADACEAFENEARAYLKRGIKTTRIKILDKKGNQKTLSNQQIDKKTIGQLQIEFENIKAPNYLDAQIAQTLAAINPDRVGVTHKKRQGRTEASLRRNVGRLMWTIINTLVEMKK